MNMFRRFFTSMFCLLCLFGIVCISEGVTISINYSGEESYWKTGWRPTYLNTAKFWVSVYNAQSGGTLTASLSNVSQYLGYCGNDGNQTGPDLTLSGDPSEPAENNWQKNSQTGELTYTFGPGGNIPYLVITCEDYAAHGKLTVSFTGTDGSMDSKTISIPYDDNDNLIADSWEAEVGLSAEEKEDVTLDVETGPDGNNNNGDGLSVFAEYRGFVLWSEAQGSSNWKYTSPKEKDVFVTWRSNENHINAYKAGHAGDMPLTVNLVEASYVNLPNGDPLIDEGDSRWVNFKNEAVDDSTIVSYTVPGHNRVWAIYVVRSNELRRENVDGRSVTIMGDANKGAPSYNSVARIYVNNIEAKWNDEDDRSAAFNNVIAHEIAHCVNLDHCPVDPCPAASEGGTYCYMDWDRDRTSASTIFGEAHNPDYDAHPPDDATQQMHSTQRGVDGVFDAIPAGGSDGNGNPGDTNSQNITSNGNIISTNTGSSSYGCDYNSEYDYCSDTGTCGSSTDSSTNGLCGHRWCLCPAADSSTDDSSGDSNILSTNTGSSSYGCDYNSEYDYCSDTGTCGSSTSSDGIGLCGHRYCLCPAADSSDDGILSTNTGSSSYGCYYISEHDYCSDTGTCGSSTSSDGIGLCGHRYCLCPAAD